MHIFFSN